MKIIKKTDLLIALYKTRMNHPREKPPAAFAHWAGCNLVDELLGIKKAKIKMISALDDGLSIGANREFPVRPFCMAIMTLITIIVIR